MAYEIPGRCITVPASTGLKQYRLVSLSTAAATQGRAVFPAAGAPVLGSVSYAGTTGSTTKPQYISVQVDGVAKIEAASGTVAAGDLVSASSIGQVKSLGAGDYAVGMVVGGSSGGAGRIVSVQLLPIGTT